MKKQMYGGIYVKPMIKHRGKFSEHPSEETWSVAMFLRPFFIFMSCETTKPSRSNSEFYRKHKTCIVAIIFFLSTIFKVYSSILIFYYPVLLLILPCQN